MCPKITPDEHKTTGAGANFSTLFKDKDPPTEVQLITEALLDIRSISQEEIRNLLDADVVSFPFYMKWVLQGLQIPTTGRIRSSMPTAQQMNKSHIMGSAVEYV